MPHKDNRSPAHVIAFFGDHGRFEGGPVISRRVYLMNILDLSQDGRLRVRLLHHTVHDPGKATLKEGTMERLLRSLTSRSGE
jgi:hypothetical protein